jgi:phosphoribosylaminoimidazole (AIR) synthetase
MGMGMAIVVDAAAAPALADWLAARLPGTRVVGSVNASGKVTHALPDVVFSQY